MKETIFHIEEDYGYLLSQIRTSMRTSLQNESLLKQAFTTPEIQVSVKDVITHLVLHFDPFIVMFLLEEHPCFAHTRQKLQYCVCTNSDS